MPPTTLVMLLFFTETVSLLATPFKKKVSKIELGLRLMAYGLCFAMLPFLGKNICLTWSSAVILVVLNITRIRWRSKMHT